MHIGTACRSRLRPAAGCCAAAVPPSLAPPAGAVRGGAVEQGRCETQNLKTPSPEFIAPNSSCRDGQSWSTGARKVTPAPLYQYCVPRIEAGLDMQREQEAGHLLEKQAAKPECVTRRCAVRMLHFFLTRVRARRLVSAATTPGGSGTIENER